MNDDRLRLVVDASVGIKLFINEPLSDFAHAVFNTLSENPPADFFVPDLFYIECANILLKYVRCFGRSLEDSLEDLADLKHLTLKSMSTLDLMEEALALANDKHLTAYNACYAVLARKKNIALITADEALAKAIPWAIWLGDFKL